MREMTARPKQEMRSSCDEFVVIGETEERLAQALALALYDETPNGWSRVFTDDEELVRLGWFAGVLPAGWAPMPGHMTASMMAAMFHAELLGKRPANAGCGPDGGEKRGWRVRVDSSRDPSVIVLQPWALFFAK